MTGAFAIVALTALLSGCAEKASDYFPGYAEAEYVRLAAPITGTLLRIVRGIMLKGNGPAEIMPEVWPIALFMLAAGRWH